MAYEWLNEWRVMLWRMGLMHETIEREIPTQQDRRQIRFIHRSIRSRCHGLKAAPNEPRTRVGCEKPALAQPTDRSR